MSDNKWYVIRTITSKEKKCKENIDFEIKNSPISDSVNQVIIPMEKVFHVRNGKKVISERNHYPGYILIEMNSKIIGEMKHLLKSINFVSGFLGGDDPISLRPDEVKHILGKIDELESNDGIVVDQFYEGESVKLIDGPFESFIGKITNVNNEKMRLKLDVKIFGRETPLEVNFSQVSKEE